MNKFFLSVLVILSSLTGRCQRARDTFRLYFDLNVAALNAKTQKKIDLLIYNDKIIHGSEVMVIGYADYLGTEKKNQVLSMARAQNVKSYLIKYGIDEKDIKLVEGEGQVDRNVKRTPEGYPTDRRVDIVVNNKITKEGEAKLKPKPKRAGSDGESENISDLKKMKPGSVFQLQNVYFPPDRHVIKPESMETLEKLFDVLHDNPAIKISIEGHVCCISPEAPDALDIDTYEPTLSLNRAKAIYNYLVKKGIDASRLTFVGFGKQHPVVPVEKTEADAEKNRRVEIRIIAN